MTEVAATDRWTFHVLLGGIGVVGAVLLRAPVLLVLVAPSLLLVAAAVTWRPGAAPKVDLTIGADRLVVGDRTTARASVLAPHVVAVHVPVTGSLVAGTTAATVLPGTTAPAEVVVELHARRWGATSLGPVRTRWWSPGGLVEATAQGAAIDVRTYPQTPPAAVLIRARATHAAHGVQRSADAGDGTEFAALRPFVPGDRVRDVNPLVSARRGQPWVVRRHPDRRTDVVLLLDAHDPRELDDVLEGARSVARGYLQHRDRVGVITTTGVLRWLPAGEGARHEHRIAAALIDAQFTQSWIRPRVEALPPQALPPGAFVLGITPGTDTRLAATAVILQRRGWDVAVLVLGSRGDDAAPRQRGRAEADEFVRRAARRLDALDRRALRDDLLRQGVPAVAWDPSTPVDTALVELRTWRRRASRR